MYPKGKPLWGERCTSKLRKNEGKRFTADFEKARWNMITTDNKAVLEPRVSPGFAITNFCNHCNIRFDTIPVKVICVNLPKDHSWLSPMKIHSDHFSKKTFSRKVNNLKWPLDDLNPTYVAVSCTTLHKDHCVQLTWYYNKVCGYSDYFQKLNQNVNDPKMTFDPKMTLDSKMTFDPKIIFDPTSILASFRCQHYQAFKLLTFKHLAKKRKLAFLG